MGIENAKWYVIHTYSGYEMMVKDSLEKLIENNNLQENIYDIQIPTEETLEEKSNGKKKVVERKKFPCYVFLKMIYSNEIWYLVTNTRGVTGFVGPQGRPMPLTPEEVARMGLERPKGRMSGLALSVWVSEEFGRLPEEEESFIYENVELTVEKVSKTRVVTVILRIMDEEDLAEIEGSKEPSEEREGDEK